jgi:hypothetical protein
MFPFLTAYGATNIGMSIHDSTFVNGKTINIPVYVDSSLTGLGVISYKLQFTYNSNLIQIDSIISAGTLSQNWGTPTYNNSFSGSSGKITIASAGISVLSGKGVLLYIKITAIGSGGNYFSFTDTLNNYFNEGSPKISFKNGYFNIQQKPAITVSPNSGLITTGENIQLYASGGSSPYTWSVTNPTVASISSSGLLTGIGAGITKVIAIDNNGVIDTSDNYFEVRAYKFYFRDTSYYQGQIISVPVYTSDLTGLNITSGQMQINFNENLITPIGLSKNGTILQSFSDPSFGITGNGQMSVSFAGSSSVLGGGVLLYIEFRTSSSYNGNTSLLISNILCNQNLPGNSSNGNLNVVKLATLSISPQTSNILAGDTLRFYASNGRAPYTWFLDDSSLASIDNTGLLHAIKGGVVVVSAKDFYGGTGSSGNISIYDSKISAADTTSASGDSVELPISLGTLHSAFSISSLQAIITFDSSIIKFTRLISTGTLTDGWSYQINNQGNKIIFAAAGTGNFNNAGIILKLRFYISPNASLNYSYAINIQQFMFNEGSPLVKIKNGSIKITSVTLPVAPGNLNANASGSNIINLSWNDNSNNESGFKIERSLDSLSNYSLIKTLSANTSTFADTGLIDGTKYYYRLYAYNSNGNSNYSNITSSVTKLKAPSNLGGSGEGVVYLTWKDNSSAESGVIIERKQGATGLYSVLDTINANATTYADSNVIIGVYYFYRVKAYNNYVESEYSNEFSITVTNIYSDLNNVPDKFKLFPNFPNPFNPSTTIEYQIPKDSFVILSVYNMLGKVVATLVNEEKHVGRYSVVFNAAGFSSGIYFLKITAGNFTSTSKMILLK